MAINGTTLRMTGMFSGIDTDSLVKSMMQIEQLKVDRQTRSLTTMQWKQEQYSSVTSDLKTFMNDFISVLGSKSMMKSGNYVTYNAAVTGKNAECVTIAGTAEAFTGSVTIDKITQLATASMARSSGGVSNGGELSEFNSAALSDLDFARELQFDDGRIAFSINDVEFEFSASDSLQKVINTVNASEAGVNMIYSRLTDSFSIEAKKTGSEGEVRIQNLAGNAFGAGGAFGIDNGNYANGLNAHLTINGIDVEKQSNKFTVDGISYTLNDVTNEDDGPIKVTLTQDVSAAVDHIKTFVEGYNTLINKLNEIVTSRKTNKERSYTALTDEEKESMSEEQIEKWEEIAKKGLLYNDSGIQGLLTSLRGALYDTIEGLGVSAADIGLRTSEYKQGGEGRGEISLNEDMLREALEKNPHQVMNAFMNASTSTDSKTAYKENGLLHRINGLMNEYIKGSGQNSISNIENSIYKTSKRIVEMEEKMLEIEERYYLKYAALEEAMSKLSSQTDNMTAMLGQL